jgi:hypothetical protein
MRSAPLIAARFEEPERGEPVGALDPIEARDRELVRAIGRGNEEAFRNLFRRYAPSAMAVARRVVGQPSRKASWLFGETRSPTRRFAAR